MTKNEQIENFLKKFKLIVNPSDESREDVANDYDVVVLFDGKKVCDTKCGGGSYWVANKVHGTTIMRSVFQDAESYCHCLDWANGDDTDAFADFLDEFGYTDNRESIKNGIKAFKGCKEMYGYIQPVISSNCSWNDSTENSVLDYLCDLLNWFDENQDETDGGVKDIIEIDWDSYVEDYK